MEPSFSANHPPNRSLPREILPPANARRLIVDVFGALLIVLVLNLAAMLFLPEYTTNYGYAMIQAKWRLLRGLEQPVDWLILGDSSVNQGVMPEVLRAELGETVVNLGTIGNLTAFNDLWMLEYYIDHFGPPKNVLIAHVYDIWGRNFSPGYLGEYPLPWGFWKELSFAEDWAKEGEAQREIFFTRYFPLYSQNRTLAGILRDSVTALRNPFTRSWQVDDTGYLPAYDAKPDNTRQDALNHLDFVAQNPFFLSYNNQIALERIGQLAQEHGFDVYFANAPLYEGLYNQAVFQEYLADVQAMLSGYTQDNPCLHQISEVKTFPAEVMQTVDHLTVPAAREYTHWLVEQILTIRGGETLCP